MSKLKSVRTHPNHTDATQVEVMTGFGASPQHIASHLSLTIEELEYHYSDQLKFGIEEANLKVAQTFFEMATSGEHPQMTAMWMKMRAKWTESPPPAKQEEEDETDMNELRHKLLRLMNRDPTAQSK